VNSKPRSKARDLPLHRLIEVVQFSDNLNKMTAGPVLSELVAEILRTGGARDETPWRKDLRRNLSTFVWNHPRLTKRQIMHEYLPSLRKALDQELRALVDQRVLEEIKSGNRTVYKAKSLSL
jgi:hypothetical protein